MSTHKAMRWKLFIILALIGIICTCLFAELIVLRPQREKIRQKTLVKLLSQSHLDALEFIKFKNTQDKPGAEFALKSWGNDIYEAKKYLGDDPEPTRNKFKRLFESYRYINEQHNLCASHEAICYILADINDSIETRSYEEGHGRLMEFAFMLNQASEKKIDPMTRETLNYWADLVPELERSLELRKKFDLIDLLRLEIESLPAGVKTEEVIGKIDALLYLLEKIKQELPYYEYPNYLLAREYYLEYLDIRKELQKVINGAV